MAITFKGLAQTYIKFGNDALAQNLFSIENDVASKVNVNVRRLLVQNDAIIANTTVVMPIVKTSRISTQPTGGLVLDKAAFDTGYGASSDSVVIRASMLEFAPIAATPGATVWQQYVTRLRTAAEQQTSWDNNLLPLLVADPGREFKLRPGENLLVRVVNLAGANLLAMNSWFVECVWEEDAISAFDISGVVTLSGTPVAGAKVVIFEASDQLMTDAVLRDVKTTDGGGAWAAAILTGKVGAAFVQYKSGAVFYTAPGSPFLENT